MAKTNTKIGEVFSVKIDDSHKTYFQLVAFDLTQLNSDVIRAFKKKYRIDANHDLLEIVNDEVGRDIFGSAREQLVERRAQGLNRFIKIFTIW